MDFQYTAQEFFYNNSFKDYPLTRYIEYSKGEIVLGHTERMVFIIEIGNISVEENEQRVREIRRAWENGVPIITAQQEPNLANSIRWNFGC